MIYTNIFYHPFLQLPFCCVPAVLQWIFYRRGLDIGNQIEIAKELGLVLPTRFREIFADEEII